MKRNYLSAVLWMVLLAVAALLAMNWLPPLSLGDVELRQVDILADLKPAPAVTADADDAALAQQADRRADSIAAARLAAAQAARAAVTGDNANEKLPPSEPDAQYTTAQIDSLLASMGAGSTSIEDFSLNGHGMEPYYAALDRMAASGGVVRIAVLGDSYIEGDIFTADLRQQLQQRYGGCGVGLVPVASETYGFRRSVKHSFSGWDLHKITDTIGHFDRRRQTFAAEYAIPTGTATVELRGQSRYYARLDSCDASSIYFSAPSGCTISASVNGGQWKQTFNVAGSEQMQSLSIEVPADSLRLGRVSWTVTGAGPGSSFYGATMDCRRGVVLDCYSMRGVAGIHLTSVPEENLAQFDRLRHYDLIVIMYGQNAITPDITNYEGYLKRMCTAIERLKRNCPGSGFLVVSVGDRCSRRDGQTRTVRGTLAMVKYQRLIAAESGVAFWNLFEAMGGEGSIVKMVEGKPQEANRDYTHINFLGGRRLAGYLFDAMVRGKEERDAYGR